MEKVKEFLKSPKKTAVLGLIGSILMLIFMFIYKKIIFKYYGIATWYGSLYDSCVLCFVGLIIYFIIVLTRIYKQKGNIKVANYILILSFILSIVLAIIKLVLSIMNGTHYSFISGAVAESIFSLNGLNLIIVTIYLFGILFRKKALINNKVATRVIIGTTILEMIYVCMSIFFFPTGVMGMLIIHIVGELTKLTIIPYFYNYYELLKEEKKSGK